MNVLAQIATPPPSPPRSRTSSESNILQAQPRSAPPQQLNDAGAGSITAAEDTGIMVARRMDGATYTQTNATAAEFNEKTPLLQSTEGPYAEVQKPKRWLLPQQISEAFVGGFKLVFAPVVYTGQYLIACFYHEDGGFSLIAPVYHIARSFTRTRRKKGNVEAMQASKPLESNEKGKRKSRGSSVTQSRTRKPVKRSQSLASNSTAMTSDSELESERPPTRNEDDDTPARHTRSKSSASSVSEHIAPAKRQIRIKLHNEEALRQRKAAKKAQPRMGSKDGSNQVSAEAAAALKSPTGPISSKQLTKFPRAPQPPRPLVPRRQPSYSASGTSTVGPHQKTLIIDLDETLIHSMAKGGRYTTGHMVEVKLQQPVGAEGQIIGPQVPILYYVHKRPHCDEFLKKVFRRASSERHTANPTRGRFVNGTI